MTSNISHLSLEKARDAALNSFSSVFNIRLFAKIAWANANMDATPIGGPTDIKPINKFCEDAKQNIVILTNLCRQAEQVLTTEILDYIALSNAPHNLPGVTIGDIRYTTAHEATLYFLKRIIACLEVTFRQIQRKRDAGATIDNKILGNAIVVDIDTLPLPNWIKADIEIEAANALAFWRSEVKQTAGSKADNGGWIFEPGKVIYKETTFLLNGILYKLLNALTTAKKPLTEVELIEAGWGHDANKEPKTLQNTLSNLRSILKKKLDLKQNQDPIPVVDYGENRAWSIADFLR